MQTDKPRPDPSPKQIRRACEAIRKRWSEADELRRRTSHPEPAEIKIVHDIYLNSRHLANL